MWVIQIFNFVKNKHFIENKSKLTVNLKLDE